MMSIVEFFSQPVWHHLSLTLVHFLWQGVVVAVIAYAAVRVLRLKRGNPRYGAYLLAFAVMAICPLVTFMTLRAPTKPAAVVPAPMPEMASSEPVPHSVAPELPQPVSEHTLMVRPTRHTPVRERLDNALQASLPWALVCWMGGVLVLSVRLLLGVIGVRRWRRNLKPVPDELEARVALLSERLGISGFRRVFVSGRALEVVALGYLRPVVLLPATIVTQMPLEMLEAVIAHELAHIRRFDLWVNLAQRIVETLLFYHPAVWWLSNRLRTEREFCCDEMAVAATGERLTYASALETAQRGRLAAAQPNLALALGQARRSTLRRVRHILGLPPIRSDSRFWLAGAIVVLLIASLTVPTALVLTAEAQEKATAALPPAPTAKDKAAATAALFRAIRDTNIERMRLAIKQGANLEGKNKDEIFLIDNVQSIGHTPLYVAAGVPDEKDDVVGLLLEAGANPNTRGPNGQIPLHAAARGANISIVEMLVSADSDVNAADKEGRTPAIIAFELGHCDKFDLMVAHGATVSTDLMSAYKGSLSRVKSLIENGKAQERFGQGLTLLHAAAAGGHTAIVELLLTNGLDVRSKTQKGYTALHHAAAGNHREVAELLLAKGADVNAEPGKQTPLHWAIGQQHKEMIGWLLARGANPNADGGDYWGTPLHWAVWWWDVDTALLLVSHGGDIHLRTEKYPYSPLFDTVVHGNPAMAQALVTKTGDTGAAKWAPLLATVASGDRQAVEDLLAKGADVNAKSDRGASALGMAAVFGHKDIARLLIEKGADVNAKAERSLWDEGMTALHASCVGGQKGVAELLIAEGADVNAKTKNGYTPLHVAVTEGYGDLAELLIAKGAYVNAENNEGQTPLSVAEEKGHTEIVELLRKHGAKGRNSDAEADQPTDKSQEQTVEADEALTLELIEAAAAGDIKQVKDLIAAGADVNAQDRGDNTALHYATQKGHLEVVKLLVAHGADVNAGAQAGWPPLLAAANEGHEDIVEFLLKNQAQVDAADAAGYTPLYYAIWADDEETVRTLIAHGADVNKTCKGDSSPLVHAVWEPEAANIKALIDAGADVNVKDDQGWTPLYSALDEGVPEVIRLFLEAGVQMSDVHKAVLEGDLARVKKLVDSGVDVDTRDDLGRPLSYWALSAGQMNVFEYLLNEGADITVAANQGSTLLHKASERGLTDVVRRLIAKGAAVNARTDGGETPLFLAATRGHKETCQLLMVNGADVNAALDGGRHPLGDATARGHEDVVRLLLANGADVNLNVKNYGTALHAAVQRGRATLVDTLINHGADVNAESRSRTVLHLAAGASRQHIDSETLEPIIKKLLDHGADVHATDKRRGPTPLHVAARRGRADAARLLLAAGADVNAKDNQGRTPLSYAEGRYATREVAELLRKHGARATGSTTEADQAPAEALYRAVTTGNTDTPVERTARAKETTSVDEEDAADASVTSAQEKYVERLREAFARGVDVDARDSWGHTILHRACMEGYGKVAEFLIGKGADVNAGNITGITPLHTAAGRGHADVVKLLLDRKADVNARDDHDATPLWYAKNGVVYSFDVFSRFRANTTARWNPENPGCRKAVELLVEQGAAEHAPIISLHEAANFGLMERVRSLVAKGADVNAMVDRLAATPLHLAAYSGHKDVIEFLIANSADVNTRNKWDRTPLHIAIDQRRTEIAELLRKHGATLEPSTETVRVKAPTSLFKSATSKSAIPERCMEIPEQMQACAANLRKIHAAIKRYEQDKGQLPAWLSDLVPDYVSKEMLMCPNNPETRVPWPVDPKLPCGYAYEFSPFRAYARFGGAPTDGMTQRDRKMAQVAFFGDVVPLCRCRLHGQTWLNVSVGGESYVSGPQWESTIMPDYKVGSELAEKPLPLAGSAAR